MSLVDCCRLCLKNLADLQLDEDGHFTVAENRDLQRMILDCFQILVTDDEIISKVCSRCNEQIRAVDKIRKRVKKVDFEIKQYYASLVVKLEDDSIEENPGDGQSKKAGNTEQHQSNHKQLNPDIIECFDVIDTTQNYGFIDECEYIKVEPLLYSDQDSVDSEYSESHSESEPPREPEVKKRKRTVPKKVKKIKKPKIVRIKIDNKCYVCETDFDTTEGLDDHISSHIGTIGETCHLCEHPISTVRYLNMHLRRVHFRRGKQIPCKECKKNNIDREFSSTYKLEAHMREEHNKVPAVEKKFICTFCGKSFNRNSNLKLHENIHTKAVLFKCKQCPFVALARSALHRHERIHTAEKPFKCDQCDACFNQSNGLHSHKAAKHSNERPFSCKVCGDEKRFKSKYTLQTHMRTHDKEATAPKDVHQSQVTAIGTEITVSQRQLKCDFCPAVYSWEKFLCQHLAEKHPDENVPMLSCELCEQADKSTFFLTQTELDRHIVKHKKVVKLKDRTCPDCGEVYQTSESYQRHRETHIKHVCKDCEKTFASRRTLRLHVITVHLKARPYKCDKCDSAFAQFTSLQSHMKTHLGPKKPRGRRQKIDVVFD